ncbi:very short patch repair endonuclease [Paradevosia shaoguanensis]|uniref:very short patch repair endonuclease n=1 Tax=Paradevosia shaoguanensis TaxID=1335043 RepID=UPI003C787470
MADIVDPPTRSRMMAGIKSINTKPERELRTALHALGFRYRLHPKEIVGRPDLVLPKYKSVVFVHGCFWHRHKGCRYATAPATRPEFWQTKFASNVARDARVAAELRSAGWRMVTVWECAIRREGAPKIAEWIASWLPSGGDELVVGLPTE